MSDDDVAQALLTNYRPTLRQRFGDAVYDIASALMPSTANRMRENAVAIADFIPGLGEALGVGDAYSNFQAGNYGQAAADMGMVAIGAVPVVGDAAARGIRVWTGGVGDPIKAAKDKGAWFSEAKDLAHEYAHGGGRVTGAYIQPKNPIEFRHAEQERTIGDFISTALEGAGSDLDAEQLVPIVERLRARYGDEARPLFEYWNNDPEIAGFLRALGYDSISVAEKGDMKSKTWAALDPSIFRVED